MISNMRCRDQRRETERRLIEQHELRTRHERAPDDEHLLLATRKRSGGLIDALGEDGKAL